MTCRNQISLDLPAAPSAGMVAFAYAASFEISVFYIIFLLGHFELRSDSGVWRRRLMLASV